MHSKTQFRKLTFRSISSAATVALVVAIVLVLTAVLAQSVQAQTFTVLYSFSYINPSNGLIPMGVIMDGAGNLYGTTQAGGQGGICNGGYQGCGTVFKLSNEGSQWTFTSLYKFKGFEQGDGALPDSGVILGSDGSLYGTTFYGGLTSGRCAGGGCGTVFKLTPPSSSLEDWTETILLKFGHGGSTGSGANPVQSPLFDRTGNLFGTTRVSIGGGGDGNVFELVHSSPGWVQNVLWNHSTNALIFGNDGNLYTTAGGGAYGCGIVLQLVPSGSGWTKNTLYTFQCGRDGGSPGSNLVFDQSGSLYGLTDSGGTYGGGTVFELSPSGGGWTFTVLYNFLGTPLANSLVLDSTGNFCGTTVLGGVDNLGTVFKLSPSNGGWVYISLHDFTGEDDGGNPTSLILGADGNLYGTTYSGFGSEYGSVFEITP